MPPLLSGKSTFFTHFLEVPKPGLFQPRFLVGAFLATGDRIFATGSDSVHRLLHGAPPRGRQLYFTFPSAPDPLFKSSKAPFLTLRVATLSGAPRQAPLEVSQKLFCDPVPWLFLLDFRAYNHGLKGPQEPQTYPLASAEPNSAAEPKVGAVQKQAAILRPFGNWGVFKQGGKSILSRPTGMKCSKQCTSFVVLCLSFVCSDSGVEHYHQQPTHAHI